MLECVSILLRIIADGSVDLPLLEEAWIISFLIKSRVAILGKKIQKPIVVMKKIGAKSHFKKQIKLLALIKSQ